MFPLTSLIFIQANLRSWTEPMQAFFSKNVFAVKYLRYGKIRISELSAKINFCLPVSAPQCHLTMQLMAQKHLTLLHLHFNFIFFQTYEAYGFGHKSLCLLIIEVLTCTSLAYFALLSVHNIAAPNKTSSIRAGGRCYT